MGIVAPSHRVQHPPVLPVLASSVLLTAGGAAGSQQVGA